MPGHAIGLLGALTQSLRWHETRQRLLAQNVANADTPNYRGVDLAPFTLPDAPSPVTLASVPERPGFLPLEPGGEGGVSTRSAGFATRPEAPGTTLEDQMSKVAGNAMDYAAVTALYTKTLQLLRTAFGNPGA